MLVALQGLDQKLFLIGLHPAEDVVLLAGGFDVLIGLQGGGIHVAVRTLNPGLPGSCGNGDRVVPGDDFHGDALRVEVGKGLFGIFPHWVAQQNESQRQRRGDTPSVGARLAGGKEQYPAAVGHGFLSHGAVGSVALSTQNKLRRP